MISHQNADLNSCQAHLNVQAVVIFHFRMIWTAEREREEKLQLEAANALKYGND